jgi:hypothetical protein
MGDEVVVVMVVAVAVVHEDKASANLKRWVEKSIQNNESWAMKWW